MTRNTYRDANRDLRIVIDGHEVEIVAHGLAIVDNVQPRINVRAFVTYATRCRLEQVGIVLSDTDHIDRDIDMHRIQSSRTLNTTAWKAQSRKEPSVQRLLERIVLDAAQTLLSRTESAIKAGPDPQHAGAKYSEAIRGGNAIRAALLAAQS